MRKLSNLLEVLHQRITVDEKMKTAKRQKRIYISTVKDERLGRILENVLNRGPIRPISKKEGTKYNVQRT
jgi:hypothetical protein